MQSNEVVETDRLTFTEEAAVNWLVRQVAPDALRILGHPLAADFLESLAAPEIGHRAPSGAAKTIRAVRHDLEANDTATDPHVRLTNTLDGVSPVEWMQQTVPELLSLASFARSTTLWPTVTWEAYYIFCTTLTYLAVEYGTDSVQWADAMDGFEEAARIEAEEPFSFHFEIDPQHAS